MTMIRIPIKGTIVSSDEQEFYEWFGIECSSPKQIKKCMDEAADGEELTFEINSGGGNLFSGTEIYSMINAYTGAKHIDVVGIAASAASVIAMAAKSRITPSGMLMIHNVSSSASGDKSVMSHESGVLSKADESVSKVYEMKTGLDKDTILNLMEDETWMTADDAVESGFIDEIIPSETLVNSVARILSNAEIEQARKEMKAAKEMTFINIEQEKLTLMKLKGATRC